MPGTPMLFQGQEFAASSPFFYFADYHLELADQVRKGRAKFRAQFRSIKSPEMLTRLLDPADPQAFERSEGDRSFRTPGITFAPASLLSYAARATVRSLA